MVDYTVDPDGRVAFVSATCARLPWLAREPALVQRLERLALAACDTPLHQLDWDAFTSAVDDVCRDAAAASLEAHTRLPSVALRRQVAVSRRLSVQARDVSLACPVGWTMRAFDEAMSLAARDLSPDGVRIEIGDLALAAYPRSPATVAVTSPVAVWVTRTSLADGGNRRDRTVGRLLRPNAPTSIEVPELTTATGVALAASEAPVPLRVEMLGRMEPMVTSFPPASLRDLPRPTRRARMVLDLGTANVRLLAATFDGDRQAASSSMEWLCEPTARAIHRLGLPGVPPTSVPELGDWVTGSLPCLARYALERHHGWLDSLAVVRQRSEDVERVLSDDRVMASAKTHVLEGRLFAPSHPTVAGSLRLRVLRDLIGAEAAHRQAHQDATNRFQKEYQVWQGRQRKQQDVVLRWFSADPGEAPAPPGDYRPLELVSERTRKALEDRENALLVDVGASGTRVDYLVWGRVEDTRVHQEGSALLLERLGLADADPDAIMRVLTRWASAGDRRDPEATRYAAATFDLWSGVIRQAAQQAWAIWGDRPFLVFPMGGGMRNPFLSKLLSDALESRSLSAELLTAEAITARVTAGVAAGAGGPGLSLWQDLTQQVARGAVDAVDSAEIAAGAWMSLHG